MTSPFGPRPSTAARSVRAMAVLAALAAAFSPAVPAAQETRPGPPAGEERLPEAVPASPPALELAIPVRQSFSFLGGTLHIEVVGEAPGELRVVRGGGGRVNVHGLSTGGIVAPSFEGRGSRARLTLTSVDARRVVYVVEVPSRSLVHVGLPGRPLPVAIGTRDQVAAYRWQ